MLTLTPTAPYQLSSCGSAGGHLTDGAQRAHVGQQQVALRLLKTLRGLILVVLGGNFGPVAECLIDQLATASGGGVSCALGLDQIELLLRGIAKHFRKGRQRGLIVVLGIEQQQLRLRQVGVGKAHVELRLELVVEQRGDLVAHQLASADRLLRDFQFGVGLQRVVEGLVDGQLDLRRGRLGIHVGGLGAQARRSPPGCWCVRSR